MTSACVATAKKVEGFRGFLPNISKTVQLIFTKLISFLGNYLWYLFEINCPGKQFMREYWTKNHYGIEEKWHFFLRFCADAAFFYLKSKI